MGYITIAGDSDGDLHSADLHNKKFGAIASVINGNIDHDNLVYPSSEFVLSACGSEANTWVRFASTTSGTPTATVSSNVASRLHAPMSSIVRIPFAGTLTDNATVVAVASSSFSSGDNVSFYLQKASSANGTYSTIGSVAVDDCYVASGYDFVTITLTGTDGQSFAAGDYVRLLVQNAAANPTYPPHLTMTLRIKTLHV